MTTNEKLHDFIRDYFTYKGGQIERKSWLRFKQAAADTSGVPCDMDTLAALFTAYTGDKPSYELGNGMTEWQREECAKKCHRIANALSHDPTSFTDLYNKGLARNGYWGQSAGAPDENDAPMRKCFKAMAESGLIKSVEVKTCGKCCIRLYYLSE